MSNRTRRVDVIGYALVGWLSIILCLMLVKEIAWLLFQCDIFGKAGFGVFFGYSILATICMFIIVLACAYRVFAIGLAAAVGSIILFVVQPLGRSVSCFIGILCGCAAIILILRGYQAFERK